MKKVSDRRIPVSTPDALIGKDGQPVFGTFKDAFKNFHLLDYKSRHGLRRLYNASRLTEWQAVEVITEKGAFLCAVYTFGILDIQLTVFFEKATGRLRVWNQTSLFLNRSHVAKHLEGGDVSRHKTRHSAVDIVNHYENGEVWVKGYATNTSAGELAFDFKLKRISTPSVVSIPIKGKYPVYSQKDLFTFDGHIRLGEEELTGPDTLAVVDDHRGFYPRHSGYDWITGFCMMKGPDGVYPFGINLTEFRLNENAYDYNENGCWDQEAFRPLPLAHFQKQGQRILVKDDYGDISLRFDRVARHSVRLNLGLFKIDYQLDFGRLDGHVTDALNQKHTFHDAIGITEYRYTVV